METIPEGYCQCGCGRETRIPRFSDAHHRYIGGKPRRFCLGHSRKNIESGYMVDGNGCWLWKRGKSKAGYGQLGQGGKVVYAHRYFYEKQKGPLTPGMTLDHLCRVRACVNPDHLEEVTRGENVRRGYRWPKNKAHGTL